MPQHESTRVSLLAEELSPARCEYDMETVVDTTAFDVTRPNREMSDDNNGLTIVDETVQDVPEDAPVTYQIVVGGSTRGNMKLVSSDGYTFVKKRTLVNGTADWRCSVRGRKSGCPAVVKQTGSDYRVAGSAHTHESKPGILTAVKVKTEVKAVAKQQLFESANVLVREVTNKLQDAEEPESSRPSHDALLKMCNRTRQGLRPKEPEEGIDFQAS
ncbi:uncharacterized protein LOC132724636 [Ruditapes philippinarum]|uniref:uncharacterized protein LOC132724636 n=1 Tax=Ruditapes philippinarum TaxID=129788 RepID=UPI00295C09E8|nr:uncharacterized protein LOC132724636 [Ruditapes philippinarum]